jgi:hypothetical protein
MRRFVLEVWPSVSFPLAGSSSVSTQANRRQSIIINHHHNNNKSNCKLQQQQRPIFCIWMVHYIEE